MSRLWPVREASQSHYERLRQQVLLGANGLELETAYFDRLGLAGLIAAPAPEARLIATLLGGQRPRWSGFNDPRVETLAAAFAWLTSTVDPQRIPWGRRVMIGTSS